MKVICEKCGTTFKAELVKGMSCCPVCGARFDDEVVEEHINWITWYYYGHKSDNGKTASLRDKPIDLSKYGDIFFLIKEFKAPPRDQNGSSEKAKEILRTYIPNAFVYKQEQEDVVRCPYCRSKEIQLVPKRFSLLTGFATNRFDRVCVNCKKKF